ncbi:MAG: hypothetical protein QNJ55_08425 [Xenococcus sp. MO_188.B8]|nr:hypothetical protein [Xenococcus sp. MO_188.B8]
MFIKTILRIAATFILSCLLFFSAIAPAQAGNMLTADTLGESLNATADYVYDCSFCGGSINQIIVGIVDPDSESDPLSVACIDVGIISPNPKTGNKISLDLKAPTKIGSYDVRFRYAQAFNCADAASGWWAVDQAPPKSATVGIVNVVDSTTPPPYRTPDTGWSGSSTNYGRVELSNFVFTTPTYQPSKFPILGSSAD